MVTICMPWRLSCLYYSSEPYHAGSFLVILTNCSVSYEEYIILSLLYICYRPCVRISILSDAASSFRYAVVGAYLTVKSLFWQCFVAYNENFLSCTYI